ncbi:MAG: arsenate reductase/protein-tyrosine-phosphatase family protein [Acidimicrobiales bacterium]
MTEPRPDLERRAALHAAMADPIRLRIVDELGLSDRSPTELGRAVGVASNLLAHHLDVLDGAGIIDRTVSRGDRRRRYVRLRPDALEALAATRSLRAERVTFVCTHNSARSQLAAALWTTVSTIPSSSAGTDPADRVHPGAVEAAHARGLDLSGATPNRLAGPLEPGTLVVTVCDMAHEQIEDVVAGTDLPVLHWSVADPAAAADPRAFVDAADELADRVAVLAASVTSA